jgi:hypothetical protein
MVGYASREAPAILMLYSNSVARARSCTPACDSCMQRRCACAAMFAEVRISDSSLADLTQRSLHPQHKQPPVLLHQRCDVCSHTT